MPLRVTATAAASATSRQVPSTRSRAGVVALLVALLVSSLSVVAGSSPAGAATSSTRLAGTDRYRTATAVSKHFFPPGAAVAFVATGRSFADALAGAPAAARSGGPLLLVDTDAVPEATRTELTRLRPASIVVLGGSAVVTDAVLDELGELTTGSVTRRAGPSRFHTAAAVSAQTWPDGSTTAYLASGSSFADALAGGAAAASDDAPVLLSQRGSLPEPTRAELARLDPDVIWVLGGTAAISESVQAELETLAPTVARLAGQDRYETSAEVAAAAFERPTTDAILAFGGGFADALAAGAGAATVGAPVLLSRTPCVPVPVATTIRDLEVEDVFVVGGQAVLSADVDDVTPCEPLPTPPAFAVYHLIPTDVAETDIDDAIRAEVAAAQRWFLDQTGDRRFRLVRDGSTVAVRTLRLPMAAADTDFTSVYTFLAERELIRIDQRVLAFIDTTEDTGACGRGGTGLAIYWNDSCAPPDASTAADGSLTVPSAIVIHELLHAVGAVPDCAPNARSGHIRGDPTDIMTDVLTDLDSLRLDPGRDDYFGHGRSDCVDVADSDFLEMA